MLTLAEPLAHAARLHGSARAVIDGDTVLSYAVLYGRCRRLTAGLRGLGLLPGDRVAVLAANGHRYVEAFSGVPAAGFVIVPLNFRLAEPELAAVLRDSGARVLLTDRDPGTLRACVERVLSIPEDYEALLETAPEEWPARQAEENVAALFYTGGTTGKPKGVMLTHRNLVANAFHKIVGCSLSGKDVFLAAPAMFHIAGVAPLVGLIWLGATIVTVPAFDPAACLSAIEEHAVTVVMPVPTMLAALVAEQRRMPRRVSSLRMIGHAGSPIANQTIEDAHATFAPAEIAQFYGATETSSIVTCFRDEGAAIGTKRMGSCGRATLGVEVRVVRPDGNDCDRGEVGEIVVRGPNVTIGYWNDPEATAQALRGGVYHTGDLGLLGDGGYLFVVDRLTDMIVSGGENVYSIEVEDALHRHPAVREAAVFGVPDATWGEAVHAVVVVDPRLSGGLTGDALEAELERHCRQLIAGYKVPKHIALQLDPLPKSGPGKISKRALRDAFRAKAARGSRARGPARGEPS